MAGRKKLTRKKSSKKKARKPARPRSRRASPLPETSENWPVWFQPASVLGSAVRYVAGLSPKFNWVGIYVLKGKVLELGPYVGDETEHTRIRVGQGVCGIAVAKNADQNVADVKLIDNYLACSLKTQSELVVLIRDGKGVILGQIDIDSHVRNAFGSAEEKAVRKVADELGALWPV